MVARHRKPPLPNPPYQPFPIPKPNHYLHSLVPHEDNSHASSSSCPPPGFHESIYQSFAGIVEGRQGVLNGSLQKPQNDRLDLRDMNIDAKKNCDLASINREEQANQGEGRSTLFVANLSRKISEEVLYIFCKARGKVEGLRIHRNERGGVYAFVKFDKISNMDQIITKMNGIWILDRRITVERAKKEFRVTTKENNIKDLAQGKGASTVEKKKVEGVHKRRTVEVIVDDEVVKENELAVSFISTKCKRLKEVEELLSDLGINFSNLCRKGRYCIVAVLKDEYALTKWSENFEELGKTFVRMERVLDQNSYNRVKWVAIQGMPLETWVESNFISIAKEWGSLVTSAGMTNDRRNRDKAFILVNIKQIELVEEELEIKTGFGNWIIKAKEYELEDDEGLDEDIKYWYREEAVDSYKTVIIPPIGNNQRSSDFQTPIFTCEKRNSNHDISSNGGGNGSTVNSFNFAKEDERAKESIVGIRVSGSCEKSSEDSGTIVEETTEVMLNQEEGQIEILIEDHVDNCRCQKRQGCMKKAIQKKKEPEKSETNGRKEGKNKKENILTVRKKGTLLVSKNQNRSKSYRKGSKSKDLAFETPSWNEFIWNLESPEERYKSTQK